MSSPQSLQKVSSSLTFNVSSAGTKIVAKRRASASRCASFDHRSDSHTSRATIAAPAVPTAEIASQSIVALVQTQNMRFLLE
ncbi:MAG: hypothetical protein B7X38_11095 [Stenotrophomonas sp. 14-69-23]|nr:MAG: hypothetical protein B7X38_11095 [Stenotrophomonas sp. 14-69-23]